MATALALPSPHCLRPPAGPSSPTTAGNSTVVGLVFAVDMAHSRYSSDEIAERGQALYEREIQGSLAESDRGKFLVLDVESGEYELDTDGLAVIQRARIKRPDGVFYGLRVGQSAGSTGLVSSLWQPTDMLVMNAMADSMSLVELLAELGGAEMSFRREDGCVAVALVALPAGRQVLAIERTYRQGICVIIDPTLEEIEVARGGNLWQLWNSERAAPVASAV